MSFEIGSKRTTIDDFIQILNEMNLSSEETQYNAIKELSERILLGNYSVSDLPPIVDTMAEQIIRFMDHSDMRFVDISVTCMFYILDCVKFSLEALIRSGALRSAINTLKKPNIQKDTRQTLFKILNLISRQRQNEVADEISFDFFISNFGTEPPAIQKLIAETLYLITKNNFRSNFVQFLPGLVKLISNKNDDKTNDFLVDSTFNIGKNTSYFPKGLIEAMYHSILVTNKTDSLIKLTNLFMRVSSGHVDEVINNVNFEGLISKKTNIQVQNNLFSTLIYVLPAPKMPSVYWDYGMNQTPVLREFAKNIVQPLLINFLCDNFEFTHLAILALAMTCGVEKPELPELILYKLHTVIKSDDNYYMPALFIANNIKNQSSIVSTGLINDLKEYRTDELWYNISLNSLQDKLSTIEKKDGFHISKFSDLQSFLSYIKDNRISAFEFYNNDFSDFLKSFLKNEKNLFKFDFSYLIEKLDEYLLIFSMHNPEDNFKNNFDEIILSSEECIFCLDDMYYDHSFLLSNSLIAVEGYFNYYDQIPDSQWKASGRLGEIIKKPNFENLQNSQIGIFNRIFETPNYKKYSYYINGEKRSEYESLFSVYNRENIDQVLLLKPYEPNENYCQKINIKKYNINKSILDILDLLLMIHSIHPKLKIQIPSFEEKLNSLLESFFLIYNGTTPAIQIILNYPFLFSKSLKIHLLKIYSLTLPFSIDSFLYWKKEDKLKDHKHYINCCVQREKIFSDGILIIEKVFNPYLYPEISFENEEGIGHGPTQEFFSIMASEFARTTRKMWRNDYLNKEEYASAKNGLFPIIGADEHLFYLFGKFCGKASSMNIFIPFPFNNAFFKLIKREEIDIRDVEPQFQTTFENPDGLIGFTSFVYPGSDDIELIPNGRNIDVTKENVSQFINLVKDFTCGKELYKYADAFKDGFYSVYQKNIFEFLTAEEICSLIIGENVEITMSDLQENIDTSGYEKDSPQIKMLFEIIVEMNNSEKSNLLKFLTGCEKLPIGGFKSLTPKLTITCKTDGNHYDDNVLPSIMTCTGNFKVPRYSSKSIMRSKLLLAINEGKDSFLLT